MSTGRLCFLLILISLGIKMVSCNNAQLPDKKNCNCDSALRSDSSFHAADSTYKFIQGALLATRFKSFDELKSVIRIEFFNDSSRAENANYKNPTVRITHCSNGYEVINVVESGISQGDMSKAKKGNTFERLLFLIYSPFAVTNRVDLNKAYLLSRRMTELFGEGDPAFYDLAQNAMKKINTPDLAFMNVRDSSEKGYLNSFNHITSQAFITSCFSEELADFIGDSHERYFHPELLNGKFTEEQIRDLDNGPVDNYVDLINNEWGQELGKVLKEKFNINNSTHWTPELLSNYLNEILSYYSWAFQIGFNPVNNKDELVIRFSNKLNSVLLGSTESK